MVFEFTIAGMKDAKCVKQIRSALKRAGFEEIHISLQPPKGCVRSRNPLAVVEIERALRAAGEYTAKFGAPKSDD